MTLLKVKNLKVYFPRNQGIVSRILRERQELVKAVDNVSFNVDEGEIVGVVGETGCGKTTLGKSIVLLVKPTDGEIIFEKQNILETKKGETRQLRRQIQMIFQDAIGSLNPRLVVKDAISEPLRAFYETGQPNKIDENVSDLLRTVDLSLEYREKYPFQLSGGEGRRVTVARSLALRPKLIVCDEPTSGLDVSISAKILNFMKEIHDEYNLAYIWISHNLHEVYYVSDRILVMYLGRIVEYGGTQEVFNDAAHPYTQALLQALPKFRKGRTSSEKKIHLKGEVPSPINPPPGCTFHPRCKHRTKECMEIQPKLVSIGENHHVACLKYNN
jgi:oligopeptide/dipeptide ABC transporter ATP-binding protein